MSDSTRAGLGGAQVRNGPSCGNAGSASIVLSITLLSVCRSFSLSTSLRLSRVSGHTPCSGHTVSSPACWTDSGMIPPAVVRTASSMNLAYEAKGSPG